MVDNDEILIIQRKSDDFLAFSNLVEQENLPYNLQPANSLSKAKKLLAEASFDIILIDYTMNDGVAFDLRALIKITPAILLIEKKDSEISSKAIKIGFHDYLFKDIAGAYLTSLPTVIEKTLQRCKTQKELQHNHGHFEQELRAGGDLRLSSNILSVTKDLMSFVDRDYIYRSVNNAYLQAHDEVSEAIIGYSIAELMGEEIFVNIIKPNLDIALDGQTVQFQDWFDFNGIGRRFMDVVYQPYSTGRGQSGVVVCAHDITEIKQGEQKLALLAKEWQQTFDTTNDAICILDKEFLIKRTNRKMEKMFLTSQEEMLGRHCWEIVHGTSEPIQDCPTCKAHISLKRETHELLIGTSWFQITVDPIIDDGGCFSGSIHIVKDISEEKETEQAILRQHNIIRLSHRVATVFLTASADLAYKEVLDIMLDVIPCRNGYLLSLGDQDRLSYLAHSSAFIVSDNEQEEILPISKAPWSDLWGEVLRDKQTKMFNGPRPLKEKHDIVCVLAVPVIHRNAIIGLFVAASELGDFGQDEIELIENVAAQIAPVLYAQQEEKRSQEDRKKLESQYRQAQKIDSIGRLAGGVAHDLNNMLSPILGFGQIIIDETDENHPHQELLQEIMDAGIRARDMVRQLLAFGRKQALEFRPINLAELLTSFDELLKHTIREDIIITYELKTALPLIDGDTAQIEQVVMNLAINAQEAMPQGGRLVFKTSCIAITESVPGLSGLKPGQYVQLSVEDSGCGIDPAQCGFVFEPFFTTKGTEEGTGLGLSTVYGIIKQHRGNIYVESVVGKGTKFDIFLPVSMALTAIASSKGDSSNSTKGTETVLVVEDNAQVRKLVSSILQRRGYKLIVAKNGDHAQDLLKKQDVDIDLLLTDIIMPGIDGKQLFEIVSGQYPGMKVLYMSGYTDQVIGRHGIISSGTNFIQKPFAVNDLAGKIRNILDENT